MIAEAENILPVYRDEMNSELEAILRFWMKHTVDERHGGFHGSIDNDNSPDPGAPKGIVLYSRILWAFSSGWLLNRNDAYLSFANRAWDYIKDHFVDKEYGGVYWSVNPDGQARDTKKQVYGLAFCIYGLSEFYKASGKEDALQLAKSLFEEIEKHSFDPARGGYFEAFSRDWQLMNDLRLSEKDENEKKTMNTHLHLVEAYANLYTAWPVARLKERVIHLLDLFIKYFIDPVTAHLHLFMDEHWNRRSSLISYGHDIEAAWLLPRCAEMIGDADLISRYRSLSIPVTDAAAGGLDEDGGLWYEFEPSQRRLVREKHSWPQAEAMIGFFNAWELTGDHKYLDLSFQCWQFVKKYIRDNKNGEWFWGVNHDYSTMAREKAGFWKCPYHNTRACIEIIRRVEKIKTGGK